MKRDTLIQHPKRVQLESQNEPLVTPIYQSVKFKTDSLDDLRDPHHFIYSRIRNPTVAELETSLARIQGCESSVVFSSGIAAITSTFLSLLRAGDHIIMFVESYKPSRYVTQGLLKKFGVETSLLSISDLDQVEMTLKSKTTKLVFFESPTNPMTRIADIPRLVKLAREHNALTVFDNTLAGLEAHQDFSIDLYIHSLTKYASGHGDVLGGAVIGPSSLTEKIRSDHVHIGATLDPHAAFLILRGLKTYHLRVERHFQNALSVAQFLQSHPRISQVYYPGLESHPDHTRALRQMKGFGCIVTFNLSESAPPLADFVRRLRLFVIAPSLGSTESLVTPAEMFFAGDLTAADHAISNITPRTVRISVGLEAPEDLIDDLKQALEMS